jgi:NAD(P)-dependent dehydrogenase (short-subunit alcohol dehydrogenase family)
MSTKTWTAEDISDLTGKTFIVTGATSGLGTAAATQLAKAGAHVVLAVRDQGRGNVVAATIAGSTEVRVLDLASMDSVRAFAQAWDRDVDVLVNNAGIMQVPQGQTVDGFELQIGTNHLGHFALTNLLLPHIRDRVVTLTSDFHRGGKLDLDDLNWQRRSYDSAQAYKDSKLANLLFARELQRRLTSHGSRVRSVAAHPGIVRTGLFGHVDGVAGFGMDIGSRIVGQNVSRGVLPSLFAATQDIPGGSLVGPSGFRQLRGFPGVVTSSKEANDAESARRLWSLSESLTGTTISTTTPRAVAT